MKSIIHEVIPRALEAGYISDQQPLVCFVDIPGVRASMRSLHRAFPKHFHHTFAAKANCMQNALTLVCEEGMGCEVASHGELAQAIRAGFDPAQIVHDEPAKTKTVLKDLLHRGICLNLDNFQELDRVCALQTEKPSTSEIGFRINPQVGAGSISPMSTATHTSKFGIALEDPGNRQKIIDAFHRHRWLTALHCHVGSQGCGQELMCAGIRKITDLAREVNETLGEERVSTIDIGGGLPVNFDSDAISPSFSDFADGLAEAVPDLFDGRYRVKTEFGRTLFAKNGFICTRVEYTKQSGGRHIALTHAGGQVATRTVFMPKHWPVRLSVFDSQGAEKTGPLAEQDIAGPLCFSGDMLAERRELPLTEAGDFVVLHDTGAYYFSMPFYYNALPAPAVYGVEKSEDGSPMFVTWRQQQTVDDMLAVIG